MNGYSKYLIMTFSTFSSIASKFLDEAEAEPEPEPWKTPVSNWELRAAAAARGSSNGAWGAEVLVTGNLAQFALDTQLKWGGDLQGLL